MHWRNALWTRYNNLHEPCKLSWEDRSGPKTSISYPVPLKTLPSDLTQTRCQVHYDENKCITITLYFKKETRGGGGTCLIQGLMCSEWVQYEIDALTKCVEKMAENSFDGEQRQLQQQIEAATPINVDELQQQQQRERALLSSLSTSLDNDKHQQQQQERESPSSPSTSTVSYQQQQQQQQQRERALPSSLFVAEEDDDDDTLSRCC